MALSKKNAYAKLSRNEQIKEAHSQRYFAGIDSEFAKEYDDIMSQGLNDSTKNKKLIELYEKLADNIEISVRNYEQKQGINPNAPYSRKPKMSRGGSRRKTHRRKTHRRKTHRRS